jgi:hypothetical protein
VEVAAAVNELSDLCFLLDEICCTGLLIAAATGQCVGCSRTKFAGVLRMSRCYTAGSLAAILVLGLTTTAYATYGHFNNMCAMGLANHQKIQTDCSVNQMIFGGTYCFISEDAKSRFMQSPDTNLAEARSFMKGDCSASNNMWNEEGDACIPTP